MPTELLLIRHGKALRAPGQNYLYAPLTELGRKQAEMTGEYLVSEKLQPDGFYSSPLRRAVETATIIGDRIGKAPIVRAGLQEMEYRELPPTLLFELLARSGVLDRYLEERIGKPFRWPLIGRVVHVLADLLALHSDGRIGLVVHGGVISGILIWYFPRLRHQWWSEVQNCSITRLKIEGSRAELVEFNRVAYSIQ